MAATESDRAAQDDIPRIEAAPFLVRLAALAIDGLIALVPVTMLTGLGSDLSLNESTVAVTLAMLTLPVKLLPMVAVLALLEALSGRTIGKAVMGLRVVDVEDGRSIGLLRSTGRRGFMVLESYALFIPSLILIPFNGNVDGHLGDRLTGAIVVRDEDVERASPAQQHRK